jgi:DNA-binding transcriptional regulator GbsR (MarR family)
MDWLKYAWLKRGKRRKEVLGVFFCSPKPLSVNEIKVNLKITMAQASFTVKELNNAKLIDCLNCEDKIGKLYRINTRGKKCYNEI